MFAFDITGGACRKMFRWHALTDFVKTVLLVGEAQFVTCWGLGPTAECNWSYILDTLRARAWCDTGTVSFPSVVYFMILIYTWYIKADDYINFS